MKTIFLGILLIAGSTALSQATFVSSQSGNWSLASTWGGAGVPGNNDNIIITSGTNVDHSANEVINRVSINSGGTLTSNGRLIVDDAYIVNGEHTGTGQIRLRGANDTIDGTGSITTTTVMRVNNRRIILSTANLIRTGSNIRCPNNDTLFNFGTLITNRSISGNSTGTFSNEANATISTQRGFAANITLSADAIGNTINYNRSGGGNQSIKQPADAYYNLNISGNNIASDRRLQSPTRVLNDFTINGATFEHVDTFSLYVGGDFNLTSGAYEADNGTVIFNGTTSQVINGVIEFNDVTINNNAGVSIGADTLRLTGNMLIPVGAFTTNNRLVVVSDASGDGSIGEISAGASVSGDVEVQRYIDMGETNWRFMGSPVTNAIFSDWKDDFITAGFPGSHFPSFHFTSIYGYNETVAGDLEQGYYVIDASDPITVGEGFQVFCGDSLNGTDPFTADLVGPINQGDINLGATFTVNNGLFDDGWNLVANPYPSPINWDSPTPNWIKVGIDDAIYIFNTDLDEFSSYVGGLGTNDGSNIIASGQAFYVKAELPVCNLTVTEAAKYDTAALFLDEEPIDNLIIRMTVSQGNRSHESIVRVNDNATDKYDSGLEAFHFDDYSVQRLELFTENEDGKLNINAISVDSLQRIPIYVVGTKGQLNIDFSNSSIRGNYCTAIEIPGRSQISQFDENHTITLDYENDTLLLELVISNQAYQPCDEITSAKGRKNHEDLIWHFNNESIQIIQPGAYDRKFEVLNAAGRVVKQGRILNNNISVTDLSSGVYIFKAGDYRKRFIKTN